MTILNQIVDYKKHRLKRGYYKLKLENRDFKKVSKKTKLIKSLEIDNVLSIIAEIKSKSPSLP